MKRTNFQTGPKDYRNAGSDFQQGIVLSVSCNEPQNPSGEGSNVQQAKINYWKVTAQNSEIVSKIRKTSDLLEKEKDATASYVNKESEIDDEGGIVFIAVLDKYSKAINSIFASVRTTPSNIF